MAITKELRHATYIRLREYADAEKSDINDLLLKVGQSKLELYCELPENCEADVGDVVYVEAYGYHFEQSIRPRHKDLFEKGAFLRVHESYATDLRAKQHATAEFLECIVPLVIDNKMLLHREWIKVSGGWHITIDNVLVCKSDHKFVPVPGTGQKGRPGFSEIIFEEWKSILATGHVEQMGVTKQAEVIRKRLAKKYPDDCPPKTDTIRKHISKEYREIAAIQIADKMPDKTADK